MKVWFLDYGNLISVRSLQPRLLEAMVRQVDGVADDLTHAGRWYLSQHGAGKRGPGREDSVTLKGLAAGDTEMGIDMGIDIDTDVNIYIDKDVIFIYTHICIINNSRLAKVSKMGLGRSRLVVLLVWALGLEDRHIPTFWLLLYPEVRHS